MKTARLALTIASIAFFNIIVAGWAVAAEPSWPVFHGPNGDNKSTETGLLKAWPEEGPPLLWKSDQIGGGISGYSGVVLAEGRIYTSGNEEVKRLQDETERTDVYSTVYCLDAKDGKILWSYRNGPAWNDPGKFPGTRSTPTIDGDYVYDESPFGQLVCLEAKTGKKVWDLNILAEFEAKNITWALAGSVIIDGENLICTPGGDKASVAALDKKTGRIVWTTPGTGELTNYATPYLFEWDGMRMIASMTQKGMIVVDAKDGRLLFSVPHETKHDINATMPFYFDGKLLVVSGYGTGSELLKLSKDGDAVKAEQLWAQKAFDNQHGGIVVEEGYAYGTTQNYKGGIWVCLNLADGEIAWDERGIRKGSCTFAEGMIYGMSEADGAVCLFKATPEKYEETGRFRLPEEGSGMYWAHPVVCGKRLYLRHSHFLYCYDVAEK